MKHDYLKKKRKKKVWKKSLPWIILLLIISCVRVCAGTTAGQEALSEFKTTFGIKDLNLNNDSIMSGFFTSSLLPEDNGNDSNEGKKELSTIATGEMKVTFIDVGQGDATLIQTTNMTALMDTGKPDAKEQLMDTLLKAGVSNINYLILTHPDADHVGNGNNVIEQINTENVIMPPIDKDTKCWTITKEAIANAGIQTINPNIGDTYTLNDASFTIIGPYEVSADDTNNSSVAIKLVHGSNSFILTGDAEEQEENAMLNGNIDLEADVLKCGHHGSSSATTDKFLTAVNPTYAVISCGIDNAYGHPHASVISKLQDDDVMIYRTDQQGTITAVSDGSNISWSSEK